MSPLYQRPRRRTSHSKNADTLVEPSITRNLIHISLDVYEPGIKAQTFDRQIECHED